MRRSCAARWPSSTAWAAAREQESGGIRGEITLVVAGVGQAAAKAAARDAAREERRAARFAARAVARPGTPAPADAAPTE